MTRLLLLALVFFLSASPSVIGQTASIPKVSKEDRVKWFFDARFGMMIHWGAYAQAGGYWKGVYEGGYSEWLKFRQIPNTEYDSLILEFNPVDFDAEKWVRIAKKAGMKYIVITAKHHDGFAMYDSKVSNYDIVEMTKFGRDPLAELSEACLKAGIKLGVYYSVDRDWHHPDAACDDRYKQCNFWDYPQNLSPGAMERWHNNYFPYAAKQIEELVTRYPIDMVWFDGIGLKTKAEVALLDSIIHTNRPYCLINSRISNFVGSSNGDYGSKGDNETPGGYQTGGWENPGTLGFSYGYSERDSFMSPKQAVHNLIEIVSKGGNYLLNVGPNGKGVIIQEAVDILSEMGSWLNIYGSSIYGADGLPFDPPDNIRLTVKPHKLFVHVLNWTGKEIVVSGLDRIPGKKPGEVKEVYMLADPGRRPLKYSFSNGTLKIDLASCPVPAGSLNPFAEVIVVSDGYDAAANVSPYPEWKYSGSMYILTTPDGADLHVSASERDFPLLVRLDKRTFNFSQAKPAGEDIRFSTVSGKPLNYQIEEWNPAKGMAAIWVKVPEIKGNSRQELKMYWGNSGAKSESSGRAVFNRENGHLTVLHMNDALVDEVGSVIPKNTGVVSKPGMMGNGMHFTEGKGIACGDSIIVYPTGSGSSTTEAWIRTGVPNGLVLGWGNEERSGKVTMNFASPPHIRMDCYWSGANVNSTRRLPLNEWIHVVHTLQAGNSRIYVNGSPDGFSSSVKNPLALKRPVGLWIGGWKDDYWFSGDVDEVRISGVARSADWIRLEYENQKPLQTLVGPIVQTGDAFGVSVTEIELPEGKNTNLKAEAGGAQKVFWILKRDADETIVAVDRFDFTLEAGRVVADQSYILQFKAVYPAEIRKIDIPVTIIEQIPEPVYYLTGPDQWNGRETIEIVPVISNMASLKAAGAADLNFKWEISGGAVITDGLMSGVLRILRSQCNGEITVTLRLNNGGADYVDSKTIQVREPDSDPWIYPPASKLEKPENNRFYARDEKNEGTLHYNGRLDTRADSVFLRVYADDKLFASESLKLSKSMEYAFTVKLKAGLVIYKVEFGSVSRGNRVILDTVTNLICGDAYIIDGQSNAEANDYGRAVNPYTSNFLRSFGCADTDPEKCRSHLWGNAVSYDNQGAKLQIGYWGIELGKGLIESQKMPVCFINGSVGGSRIDVHQKNPLNPTDSTTIYGRLLWRIRAAGLTHGIRGVFWHQGENDQGAAGPDGRFGWEGYQQYFIDMAGAWKQDYPNTQNYYIFQIWPRSCAMTENGSDNVLREVQRTLPRLFSNMSIMSTLGIKPPGGCHFPPEGYAEIAHLIQPVVEKECYGRRFDQPVTPPDLQRAWYSGDRKDEITLEFDQPVVWRDSLETQFYLDGESGKVASGSASGNVLRLKLKAPSAARRISYLDSKTWSQNHLLWGENGIAALTFWGVPLNPEAGEVFKSSTFIKVTDENVFAGLSPYNWICKDGSVSSSVSGASLTVQFQTAGSVALQVDTRHMIFQSPDRFPIIAWSVNGGPVQSHQLCPGEKSVILCVDITNPLIDLYIKGISPFEDRFNGDLPPNSLKIDGILLDDGGVAVPTKKTKKIWLTIGDSILAGDGAALSDGQGRPADDKWASSDEARASYGYLLAQHFGYRESRLAFGGYNWGGGMAGVPALNILIDSATSSISRLKGDKLDPTPDVVLINLGENGAPAEKDVTDALKKLRSRVAENCKIMVMVPVSGRAGSPITKAFNSYQVSADDDYTYLVDLKRIWFETGDGQHPTAAGHESIFKAAMPTVDAILKGNYISPVTIPLWSGPAPESTGRPEGETPVITVCRPVKPNGTAMVICPGGGYGMLVTGPEGQGIAQWLNNSGITGIVLEYRLPKGNYKVPLLDVQQAIRLVRSKAGDWNLDPDRIGIIGFSAGGHLASTAATHFDSGDKQSENPIARISSRPDFTILIYPVITMGQKTHQGSKTNLLGPDPSPELINLFSNEKQVTVETPPAFLAHAQNDGLVSPDNSQLFYEALVNHQVPAQYLKLPSGDHGLNGYAGPMWDSWQAESLKWLSYMKFLN